MLTLLQTAREPLVRLLAAGLDFVAPPVCPACGLRRVGSGDSARRFDATLCDACVREMAPPLAGQCRRCAASVGPYLDTRDGCVHCRDDRFAFVMATSVGRYAGRLQWGCLRAKRPDGEPMAAALAGLLCDLRGATLADWRCDVAIPVPPFWASRLWRRQHAATVMAEVVARRLKLRCRTDILAKRRPTAAQSSLPAAERRRNLRGAFAARKRSVSGRRVLLVDDVLTTGRTAHRCARVLLEAGAESVHVAVVARGLGKPAVMGESRANGADLTAEEPRAVPPPTSESE